jgi:hypothetical protein
MMEKKKEMRKQRRDKVRDTLEWKDLQWHVIFSDVILEQHRQFVDQ